MVDNHSTWRGHGRAAPVGVWIYGLAMLLVTVLLSGCASRDVHRTGAVDFKAEEGLASFYADRYHGRRTASGERFDQQALTAAHRTLPFGTRVKVTRLDNGRHTVVRINDRGPFVRGRIIDLSRQAARELGMEADGMVSVRIAPAP
ncbi:septal ring lytic transglycosylase RlpA family protein [Litchfieldella rifensis]|uniref:Endolytic peptidoglycan transglycosylase RlpA n=1 Tax=Litchfieldella rifensis TaxID=762643 RepID=A0ABV7LVF1_9GAMM